MRVTVSCTQDHGGAIYDGACAECQWARHASREYTEHEIIDLLRKLRDLEP